MDRVTIRLPQHVVQAYDEADGTRSAVMRRRLTGAIAEGELSGVPDDLAILARREQAIDANRLPRERGKFRDKCYGHFHDAWQSGAVTPADARDRAKSYRQEAALYGPEYVGFVQAILDWWEEHYSTATRPEMPPAGHFVEMADPDRVDLADEILPVVMQAAGSGADPDAIRERLGSRVPEQALDQAVKEVFGDA